MCESNREGQKMNELYQLASISSIISDILTRDGEAFRNYLDNGPIERPSIVTTRLVKAWDEIWRDVLSESVCYQKEPDTEEAP